MWLDKYPDDFCKSEDLAILNQLMAYLLVNMPFSELTVRVHRLLTQLEDLESTDTQLKHSEETFSKWLITGEEVWVLALTGSRLKRLVFFATRHQFTPVWEDVLFLGEILGISWQVGSSLCGKAQAMPLIMPSFISLQVQYNMNF
jgi:hypothetical protein